MTLAHSDKVDIMSQRPGPWAVRDNRTPPDAFGQVLINVDDPRPSRLQAIALRPALRPPLLDCTGRRK